MMLKYEGIINNFNNINCLCIGDIMLDIFVYGKVDRISPEAPVPILNFKSEKKMLGGCGNVIANLSSLGCNTTFIGVVGEDKEGEEISSILSSINCKYKFIKPEGRPTTVKKRFIANNNHILRSDYEDKSPITDTYKNQLISYLNEEIDNADIVLLSDYNKGVIDKDTAAQIINICKKHNKKVIVDSKDKDHAKYSGADLMKINLKEFSLLTDTNLDPTSITFSFDVEREAQRIFNDYNIKNFIITLSEHGMILVSSDMTQKTVHIPTEAKEVFDVSGAGDTCMSALGAAIASGAALEDAMKIANIASGVVVQKLGTATVSAAELKKELSSKQNGSFKYRDKIVTIDEARNLSEQYKLDGKKVGFTNGCFDLLHLGHLTSLMQAKDLCDVLFIGMNSDASVKRYKGPTRPFHDQETRSQVLAALGFVDHVVVFDNDTAMELVEAIMPDVIAKEGYTIDKWPEAQKVKSYNGEVVTLSRVDGYSTSSIISNMQKAG